MDSSQTENTPGVRADGRSQPQVEPRSRAKLSPRTHASRRGPGLRCRNHAAAGDRTDPPRAGHADARDSGDRHAHLPDRKGGGAPLEAQTAADAAALAGARTVRDQLDRAGRHDRHLGLHARQRADRARRRRATTRSATAPGCVDFKLDGADVRAWVDTNDEIDPPKQDARGQGVGAGARRARDVPVARARLRRAGGGGAGRPAATPTSPTTSGRASRKDLHHPPAAPTSSRSASSSRSTARSRRTRTPSSARRRCRPAASAPPTSQHYACGNSGAIDLNYPPGIEASVIDEVRPHVDQARLPHALAGREPLRPHAHRRANLASPAPGSGLLGAAGSLTDSFLQVKLIDWDAPSAIGLGALFVGGAGGIPFGPPDPQVADAMCQVLDRMNVSPKVRLAAWETAIVESGVQVARLGRPRLRGPVPAAPVPGLGHAGAGPRPVLRDGAVRAARAADRGPVLGPRASSPRRCRSPAHGERYAQRAGPGGGAQREVLRHDAGARVCGDGLPRARGLRRGCGGRRRRPPASSRRPPRVATAPPAADPAAARLRGRRAGGARGAARSRSSTSRTASRSRRRRMDVNARAGARAAALVGLGQRRGRTGRGTVRTLICDPNCAQRPARAARAARSCCRSPSDCGGRRYYTRSSMTYEDPDTGKTRAPATYLRTPPC